MKKKLLAVSVCAIIAVMAIAGSSLAWLKDETGTVVNTFTEGKVDIDLYETKGSEHVMANAYKMIPGNTLTKDPTIHVEAGSEECYLFVKVTDEIAAIQDANTVATQMDGNKWLPLSGEEGVYYLKDTINASKSDKDIDVPVFADFTIKGDAEVAGYDGKTITVQAYAVQKDGFDTAAKAWEAASATWGDPEVSQ